MSNEARAEMPVRSPESTAASVPRLRVLVVDDSAEDRELIRRELESHMPGLAIHEIPDEGSFRRSLGDPEFDLVITDYALGWSDGLAVLRAVRSRYPDCPVIMFTGTGTEEVAVEAMKSGLDDYVLKRHLVHLPRAVTSVLSLAMERKARARSDALLDSLYATAPVGLAFIDPELRFVRINETLAALDGISPLAHVGRPVRDVLPDLATTIEPVIRWVFDRRKAILDMELGGETPAHPGETRNWSASFHPVTGPDGELLGVGVVVADITARKRVEQERRSLVARLVRAEEDERERIASDLHDDPVQAMTAVGLRLQSLRRLISEPVEQAVLKKVEEEVERAIGRLRALVFELRPPTLDREGLGAAIRLLLTEAQAEGGSGFWIEDLLQAEPSPDIRVIAYRIVQEAVANVRKHANAGRVVVTLDAGDGGLFARVHDNGVGFSPDRIERPRPGHLGIGSMRERAELSGGWLRILSAPGAGTSVEFWLPDPGLNVEELEPPVA